MKKSIFSTKEQQAQFYIRHVNKLLFGLVIALIISGIINMMNLKKQTIIMVPTNSPEQSYYISNNMIDTNYMNLLARNIMSLALNISPETIKSQYDTALQLVTPELRSYLMDDMKKSIDDVISNGISQTFYVETFKAIQQQQVVYVTGYLKTYINNQQISNVEQVYKIQFKAQALTVKVSEFRLLDNKKDATEMKAAGV